MQILEPTKCDGHHKKAFPGKFEDRRLVSAFSARDQAVSSEQQQTKLPMTAEWRHCDAVLNSQTVNRTPALIDEQSRQSE
jgi:hypothetical protein